MDATLTQILQALVAAHAEIDALRARNRELEQQAAENILPFKTPTETG